MRNRLDIIQDIKNELKNNPNAIEGSFAMDIIEAISVELEKFYQFSTYLFDLQFLDTAKGEYLDRRALEYGIERRKATYSVGEIRIKGTRGVVVEKGAIFYADDLEFIATETKVIDAEYIIIKAQCNYVGVAGNVQVGQINKTDINGISEVVNPNNFIGGFDTETDDEYRQRIITRLRLQGNSGNIYNYINWAMEVEGVGKAKCFPIWQGPGTVKISILDKNLDAANTELIKKVKDYISPDNKGSGRAPIGVDLSVTTATVKNITISVDITTTTDLNDVKANVKKNVENYLKSLSYSGKNVSYARIGDLIIDTNGVNDYENLRINGGVNTIALGEEEIPRLLSLEVV